MSSTLGARVAILLGGDGDAAAAEALLDDLKARSAEAQEEQRAVEAKALDPLTRDSQAIKLNAESQALGFEAQRCARQADAVEARWSVLRHEEREAEATAARAAAFAERDELAAELKRTYPKVAAQLTDLYQRLDASSRRLQQLGVHDTAEQAARGFRPGVGGTSTLAETTRLPSWEAHQRDIWPKPFEWIPPPASSWAHREEPDLPAVPGIAPARIQIA